jgi:hypothetical protein
MDFEFEDRFRDLMKLRPSEYWRRQCKATFQFDPIGTKLVDDIGVETLMWGSDYPNTDGVWPESSKYIARKFQPRRRGRFAVAIPPAIAQIPRAAAVAGWTTSSFMTQRV